MITTTEIPGQEPSPQLKPAVWGDLFIYLVGGLGLYFLASLALGFFFSEMNIWTTFLLGVLNFLCLAGSVYLFGVLRKKMSWESLGLLPLKGLKRYAKFGAAISIAVLPYRFLPAIVIIAAERLLKGNVTSLDMREQIFSVGFGSWYGIVLMVLSVGILAPIAEELLFRGMLYDFFRQKTGVLWAVLITSGLFGLAHYDSFAVVVSTFVMGVVMAYVVEKTKSLWVSIFIHVATNSGAILVSAMAFWLQKLFSAT